MYYISNKQITVINAFLLYSSYWTILVCKRGGGIRLPPNHVSEFCLGPWQLAGQPLLVFLVGASYSYMPPKYSGTLSCKLEEQTFINFACQNNIHKLRSMGIQTVHLCLLPILISVLKHAFFYVSIRMVVHNLAIR